MGRVLRVYWLANWKMDVFILLLVIALVAFFKNPTPVAIAMPFFITRATATDNKFIPLIKMLVVMPVQPQHIVQARFVYDALIVAAFFVPTILLFALKYDYDIVVIAGLITGAISFFNIFIARVIAVDFFMKKPDSVDYILGIIPACAFIGTHVILIVVSTSANFWLFMLPIPLLSFIVLHYYYKKSLRYICLKQFA